jgi:hypothetical protein
MTLVEHVGRQLIEEGKFGKDEGICPHSLKKKSQRCGATLSLVKDQIRWKNWMKVECTFGACIDWSLAKSQE